MNEKKIYIVLTDTGTLFTRMIKLYTRKPFNHASISWDSNLDEVYSFGRKNPRNPFIGGFVKEDIKTGLFKNARAAIYSCSIDEVKLQKMNQYIQKLEADKEQYRYNLIGLFGVAVKKPVKRKNAFFCSQFVATVLVESDIMDFSKPLSLVTPQDLQEAENFQLEFQGNLANFYTEQRPEHLSLPSFI